MNRVGLFLFFLGIFFGVRPQLMAQQSGTSIPTVENSSTIKLEEVEPEVREKKLSIDASIEVGTNLEETTSYDKGSSTTYFLVPAFKISDRFTALSKIKFVQQLVVNENNGDSDFTNTEFQLVHKAVSLSGEELVLVPKLSLVAPTSLVDREEKSFRSAFGYEQDIKLGATVFSTPIELMHRLGLRRNIHEWDRTNTGASNTQYSMSNLLALTVGGRLSVLVYGLLGSGLTYTNTITSKYEIAQEVTYKISEATRAYVGHSNAGATLNEDMNTSNVEFFNPYSSSLYGGFGVTY